MKIARMFVLAGLVTASAAFTTPARADVTRSGTSCVPQAGYENNVGYDNDGIFSVGGFAYIICITSAPQHAGVQTLDVSGVDVRFFASNPDDTNLCLVRGETNGSRTFGPELVKTSEFGESVVGFNVPASNQSRLVVLDCYLGDPSAGPMYLMDYTIRTR
jgi:hypothetical protein